MVRSFEGHLSLTVLVSHYPRASTSRPTTPEVGGPLSLRCSAAADSTTEWTLGYHPPRDSTTGIYHNLADVY